MGRSTPQSHAKRQREQQKRDKRRAKEDKRAARKAAKQTDNSEPSGDGRGQSDSVLSILSESTLDESTEVQLSAEGFRSRPGNSKEVTS